MAETMTAGKPVITLESLGINMKPQDSTKLWSKQKFIMLGESKTGKTKFWSCGGDKTFFFRTEAGHNHVRTIGEDCRSLDDILATKEKLMKAKSAGIFPFETLVIDTGDRYVDYVDESVLDWASQKYKKEFSSIGDIAEGIGWFVRMQKINQILKQFEEFGCAVCIIFHTAQDSRTDEAGKAYKKDTINVGGKAGTAILAWADHILNIRSVYVGDIMARKMLCRGSKTVEAGSRQNLPPAITWVDDDVVNFKNFRAMFE
jgi:hypothetical protein